VPRGKGRRGQGLKQKRLNSSGKQGAGRPKPAAEGAAGQAEVSGGLRRESGGCDPPAGVAGVDGSGSGMQMRKNWQGGCAGGKAKKSHPPRSCAPWAKRRELSRRVGQPQQLCVAACDRQSLGNTLHRARGGSPRPLLGPGRGSAGREAAPGRGRYRHRTGKVTAPLPQHAAATRPAKGTRTAAADLEPLCKFTRGCGKTNTEEPSESCSGESHL